MNSKLIVALDCDTTAKALALSDSLDPQRCALKVGSELFTCAGPELVTALVKRQFKVFLDLKFHDIPHTVEKACKASADLGVWMMNVHACGGLEMMRSARAALEAYGANRPLLIAVTVLTSCTQEDLSAIGIFKRLPEQAQELALLAKKAGLDGVVSSAHEVQGIKAACGSAFITVTPGIRPSGSANHDQKRIMTPKQAIEQGSDYLVIGRPITQAPHPEQVVQQILSECSE